MNQNLKRPSSTLTMSDSNATTDRPTSGPRRLPTELTDLIVDFLHDDDESLANCALVCKEWLPAARYHIFGRSLLHPRNVEAFLNLITDPSATVLPYIRYLVMDRFTFQQLDLFNDTFPRLPLRGLELTNIWWRDRRVHSLDGSFSAFKGITDMRLGFLVCLNPTDALSVVACFPSLKRLSLINSIYFVNLSHESVAHIFPILRPPNIHDLELRERNGYPTYILEWLSTHGTVVDSLSVTLYSLSLPSLNEYLQVLGPSLLFLRINLRSGLPEMLSYPEMILSSLNLSSSTHLRKLHFYNFYFRRPHSLSYTIPSMFAKTASSDIHEIEFAYGRAEREQFLSELENDAKSTTSGSSMWSALDDVLSTFSNLRTIRFRLSPAQPNPLSFAGYIRRGLSSCNARGLLFFEPANWCV